MKERILSFLLMVGILSTLIVSVPVSAAEPISEACGDNLTWVFEEDGTLTVSGSGAMWDKTAFAIQFPWEATGIPVKKVIVEEGVTSIGALVFCDTDVVSVTLPSTLTKIGDRAFKWCDSLEEINLPDSLTYLGIEAFYCTKLEEVTIPAGIGVIEDLAFSATQLKSVTIPEGITEIQDEAFSNCKSLAVVKFPSTLRVIHDYAFEWCEALTSVTIPKGVTTLGEGAFWYCTNLTEISLPDGILNFDNKNSLNAVSSASVHAFSCTGYAKEESNWENGALYIGDYLIEVNQDTVGEVTVKEGTKYIADLSFYRCKKVTKVTLPDSVEDIYYRAFLSCSALAEIEGGAKLRHVGQNAFDTTPFYTNTENWTDGILYVGGCLVKAESDVEEVIVKEGTLSVGDYAFAETTLSKVTLPETLKHIGCYAFQKCSELTEMKLPGEMETIGDSAFQDCDRIPEIIMPDTVTYLGADAFWRCAGLKKVRLSTGLTEIKDSAFSNCTALEAISIPTGVKTIEASAFSGCKGLTTLTIGGAETIGNSAFYACTSLKQVNIPDSVTYLGEYSFSGLEAETITIGKGLKTMVGGAFLYNSNQKEFIVHGENPWYSSQDGVLFNKDKTLMIRYPIGKEDTEYTVPDGVIEIGVGAMFNVSLQNLIVSDTVKIIGRDAAGSSEIYNIQLGNQVESIGAGAFSNVWYLEEIVLPDSVKEIGYGAFSSSSLSSVDLGEGLIKIGESAFYGSSVDHIQFPDSLQSIGEKAFADCKYLYKITIPKNVVTIGEGAFRNCTGLISIGVAEENIQYCSVDECLFTKDKKTLLHYPQNRDGAVYTLPEGVENVGDYAMYNCGKLETVILPQGMRFIGENAFANSGKLTTLYIPDSVTETGKATFVDNCRGFGTIYYGGNETEWRGNVDFYSRLLDNTDIAIHYYYKYFTEDTRIVCDGETTTAYLTPGEAMVGKSLVFALYQEGILTGVQTDLCGQEPITMTFPEPHDQIKILYWGDLVSAVPAVPVEEIDTEGWMSE